MPTPLRVLIAVDVPADTELLKHNLSLGTYDLRCQHVQNVVELELALEHLWDVLLLEDQLDGADSLEVLQAVRLKGVQTPVIMLSNSPSEEQAVRAMKSGAQDYVSLDNTIRIVAIIEREMQEAAARRERQLGTEVDQLIQRVDLGILRGASLRSVLVGLCEGLSSIFDADMVWIVLKDHYDVPQVKAWAGRGGVGGGTPQSAMSKWMNDKVYLGSLLGYNELSLVRLNEPNSPAWGILATGSGFESAIVIPLSAEHALDGAVCLFSQNEEMINSATVLQFEKIGRQASLAIRMAEDQMKMRLQGAAMDSAANAIFMTDPAGKICWVNESLIKLSGYTREELMSAESEVIHGSLRQTDWDEMIHHQLLRGETWRGQVSNRRKNGSYYSVNETITPIRNEAGSVSHLVYILEDITSQLEAKQKLYQVTNFDALTGLPNRSLFRDRVEQAVGHSGPGCRKIAVLLLDLDRFKNINDTLGHEVGDSLLWEVSERLRTVVQEPNALSRQGGDEFGVLLPCPSNAEAVAIMARRLVEAMAAPFSLSSREVFVTPSIGIAMFPGDGKNADELICNADTAMYRAKEEGRNTFQFFTADMNTAMYERLNIETQLRRVLDRNELALAFQPKASLLSREFYGMEVLVRWQSHELGPVSPALFIPIAEETGSIIQIGEWVLLEACRAGRRWLEAGTLRGRVAVNVSGRQFDHHDLPQMVDRVLNETGFPADKLELEVTESTIIRDPELAITVLEALGRRGISIAVDDFGTGYSSLNYLKRLPIHTLKIDRSFVNDIGEDADGESIVRAIVAMAKSLGLAVVAEGVETEQQAAFLTELGCEFIQGYLFSKPLLQNDMNGWLQSHQLILQN